MVLASGLGVTDAGFEDVGGFFDELAVQIDGVGGGGGGGVVLEDDVGGGAGVEGCGGGFVLLGFDGEGVGCGGVGGGGGLVGLRGEQGGVVSGVAGMGFVSLEQGNWLSFGKMWLGVQVKGVGTYSFETTGHLVVLLSRQVSQSVILHFGVGGL